MGVILSGSGMVALPARAIAAGQLFFFLEFAAIKQHARLFLGGFWVFIFCFNSLERVFVCRPCYL